MKKMRIAAVVLAGMIPLLAACGAAPSGGASSGGASSSAASSAAASSGAAPAALTCVLVDGAEDGNLLLAKQNGTQNEVYRLEVGQIPVTVDGEAAAPENLTDGMTVTVAYSGNVLETFPGQLSQVSAIDARRPMPKEYADLCGLYLRVLDDLWKVDEGLNGDLTIAGVDLSDEPSGRMADSEKTAIAWRFGEEHGVETVLGTYDELSEQGYIDGQHLQWEDGCLFSIQANHSHDAECSTMPTVRFDAKKWRSGTGAYFFNDCACAWSESGTWTDYRVGSEAIS